MGPCGRVLRVERARRLLGLQVGLTSPRRRGTRTGGGRRSTHPRGRRRPRSTQRGSPVSPSRSVGSTHPSVRARSPASLLRPFRQTPHSLPPLPVHPRSARWLLWPCLAAEAALRPGLAGATARASGERPRPGRACCGPRTCSGRRWRLPTLSLWLQSHMMRGNGLSAAGRCSQAGVGDGDRDNWGEAED